MNLKVAVAAAGVLLAGTVLLLERSDAPPAERQAPTAALDAPAAPSSERPVEPPPIPPTREAAAPSATRGAEPVPAATPALEVQGFVRDLDGVALAGVDVVFERGQRGVYAAAGDVRPAASDSAGAFVARVPPEPGRLTLVDSELVCVAPPQLDGTPPLAPPIVVAAPACTYAGLVVAPSGEPAPGAAVEITLPGSFVQSRDVGGTVVHLLLPFGETRTDEHGRFRFERAGSIAGAIVAASADGFGPASVPLPERSHEALELVLAPPPDAERIVHGLVLDATGAPAAGARVSLGGPAFTCGADGRFALALEPWRAEYGGTLRAVQPGALPAELELAQALRPSSPERPIVLELGAAPLALRGRVLDADGEPVAGALVWTPDLTPFGSIVQTEGEHSVLGETMLETVLASRSGPWSTPVSATAGPGGEFELAPLLDREYTLFALDPRTLDGVGPVAFRAGTEGARVVLGRGPRTPIAGRVVSRSGVPLAAVRVTPGRRFDWNADEGPNAAAWEGWHLRSRGASAVVDAAAVETDAEGRFALPPVVARGSFLSLRGPALVLGASLPLDGEPDPSRLELVVDAASRFRLVLGRPLEADSFALEDAAGETVPLFLEVEGATISTPDVPLEDGRSGIVLAEEGTYTLVLRSGEEVARRVEVLLTPGGLHELRP